MGYVKNIFTYVNNFVNWFIFYNCFRALELAIKHKKYLNTVIYKRRNYLDFYKKEETNDKFLKYSNVWDTWFRHNIQNT